MGNLKFAMSQQKVKRPILIALAAIGLCLSLISVGLGEKPPQEHWSYFKSPLSVLFEPLPIVNQTTGTSDPL